MVSAQKEKGKRKVKFHLQPAQVLKNIISIVKQKECTDGRIKGANENETEGDLMSEKEHVSPKIHHKHPSNLQRNRRQQMVKMNRCLQLITTLFAFMFFSR